MKVIECIGDLRYARRDELQGKPGCALLLEELPQAATFDPVHHEVIKVALEEVVPDGRQAGVGGKVEEQVRFAWRRNAVCAVRDRPDLDRDSSAVLTVARDPDFALAPAPYLLEQFVASSEQLD
jgi:hypothetical protein